MTGDRRDAAGTHREVLEIVGRDYRERHAPPPLDPNRNTVWCARPVFGDEELRSLVDSSVDFYLATNRLTEEFEARAAELLIVPLVTTDGWCLRWRSQLICDGGPDEAPRQHKADHL